MSKKQIIKWVLLSFLGLFILWASTMGFKYISAPFRGKVEAREKIESANHRIYSYEFFYDLYGTIKAKETLYESQKRALKHAESKSERERIRQNISGIRSSLRRRIEEYNMNSRKVKTKGKFKADDLPVKIKMSDIINEY